MKIGVSALLLRTEGGFQKAGICRYIIRMLDDFAANAPDDEFWIFVPHDVDLPEEWTSRPNFHFERVVIKNRLHRVWWEHSAPRQWVRLRGLDLWFSTAQCTPFACGAPRATMVHDLIPILFPQFFSWQMAAYQRWTLKHSCRAAELVLTNSEATKADIVRIYGTLAEKIVVAPLGPGNTPSPVPRESVTEKDLARLEVPFDRYIFTLSTLEPRKNLGKVFEALKELDFGLVVGGAKGWKDSGIFETLKLLGVEDRVKFLGYVQDEDLPALFARSEAFVYASIYEGFGIPVLEGMLMGTPVATSDQPALQEVGGDVAQYFDPENPSDIARIVGQVINDPDREGRIRRGFERASLFTWAKCGEITRTALAKLVH